MPTPPFAKAIRLTAHKPMPVQSGKYEQVKPDWHLEGTSENPLNPHKRLVEKKPTWIEGPSKIGTYRISEDKSLMNHYFVNEIQAVTRGGGRAALNHLTAAADRHGVSLSLVAEPITPQGEGVKMTRSKLRSWYQQHGFRPSKGDLMTRTPNRMEKSMPNIPSHIPDLEPVKRGVLSCPDCDHTEQGDHAKPCPQCLKAHEDGGVAKSLRKGLGEFASLYARLEKAQFFQRQVVFGSTKNPVNEGRTTTTAMRDGSARRIRTGAVKTGATPDAKKTKLKKEVETVVPSDFMTNRQGDPMISPSAEFMSGQLAGKQVKTKDTDTAKTTFMRDGSVAKIRLFAKALLEAYDAYLAKAKQA